jgi:hypothetical protein
VSAAAAQLPLAGQATLRPSDVENLAGQDTGRDHLSHSALNTLLACRRRYFYDKVERLELIQGPRALGMGKAFQKAIEHQDPQAGVTALRDQAPAFLDQDAEDKLRIEEATVRAAAALYLSQWPGAPAEQREVEYLVRLRNPWTGHYSRTFDLLGYADGVIDCGGYLELIENKFVGQIDALTIKKLNLDRQLALECYGLWRATGKPVRQVRYRFTRKPSIKPRKATSKKPAESVGEFVERLEADYQDPERREFYSREEQLFRSDQDLLETEKNLWTWSDVLRQARRRGHFDQDTSRCSDWGGCPYIPLCVGDPDAPSLYQERPPHPESEAEAA